MKFLQHRFVETVSVAFGATFAQALALVPTGLTVLVACTVLLWQNEARRDWRDILDDAEIGDAQRPTLGDGAFASVTAALAVDAPVADDAFFASDRYAQVQRVVETYAWTERVEEEVERRWGGGRDIHTIYSYEQGWTGEVFPSDGFRYPDGHENPRPEWGTRLFAADAYRLGSWTVNGEHALPLVSVPIMPADVTWTGAGESLRFDEGCECYYIGGASPDTPRVGDQRVRFVGVPQGLKVTAFGNAYGAQLGPREWVDGIGFVLLLPGSRSDALDFAGALHTILLWLGRFAGVVAIWFGLTLVIAPLFAVFDIVPPVGAVLRFTFSIVLLPVAIIWGGAVISASMVLHNPVLLALALFALYLVGRFALDRRREKREYEEIMRAYRQQQDAEPEAAA